MRPILFLPSPHPLWFLVHFAAPLFTLPLLAVLLQHHSSTKMADKPEVKADSLSSAAGKLKKTETKVKNVLPTKDDIEAEKSGK
eukprot:m.410784 g.410784  ORF g.410784 m.410784 type:complete len:84 (-) comp28479_c0_seq1:178-429(-)